MQKYFFSFLSLTMSVLLFGYSEPSKTEPIRTVIDINISERQTITIGDLSVALTVISVQEKRDIIRNAIRSVEITLKVNSSIVKLNSGNYNLPIEVGDIKIDCPVTIGYISNSDRENTWGLKKDVRLRLWPVNSPFITPGTFVCPVEQRWFTSSTQMSNEPVYVDGGEIPANSDIYYHYGLDFGGAEGMVDVLAATNAVVVSVAGLVLEGDEQNTPVAPRYDVIYLLDERGWYYRYSHLKSIETNVRLGHRVKMGQKIGTIGKEGGSGGWSHLHFDINAKQPSGEWGIEEGYDYLWQAYRDQYNPALMACVRPHHLLNIGEKVTIDGSKSLNFKEGALKYEWIFSDGTTGTGAKQDRTYTTPGTYSEILKIMNTSGDIDYDFAIVNVVDINHPENLPPTLHAAYSPTFDIRAGDPVTFKTRTFRDSKGNETWDFGDGSPIEETRSRPSNIGDDQHIDHAEDGYAEIIHRFAEPGCYIVKVGRNGKNGFKATAHLCVIIAE